MLVRRYARRLAARSPSVNARINLVDECLFMFLGGALIHGRPRICKSCAIDFVLTNLNAKSPSEVLAGRCPKDPLGPAPPKLHYLVTVRFAVVV